jgi:hypothetical protein
MTLEATEFLRRFTQHILPRGFVRIRQFGFLTNTRRSTLLALARLFILTFATGSFPDGERKPPLIGIDWLMGRHAENLDP